MEQKLQTITKRTGLQVTHEGDTVTVWRTEDEGYELLFAKSKTAKPYQREVVTGDMLEDKMRELQNDLRKWRTVTR